MSHYQFRAPIAKNLEELIQFLDGELYTIYQAINDAIVLDLRVIHEEPHRPRDGIIVFADGTDWDPGAGRGLYVFDGTWKKITHT